MQKLTILLLVVCAVIAATAEPARKKNGVAHRKSAKIVRVAPAKNGKFVRKSMKPARRFGKIQAEEDFVEEEEQFIDEVQGSVEQDVPEEVHHFVEREVPVHHEHHLHHEVPVHHPHHVPVHHPHHEARTHFEIPYDVAGHHVEHDFDPNVAKHHVEYDVAGHHIEHDITDHHVSAEEDDELAKSALAEKTAPAGGSYFNTHFGAAKGGAIALGNSYSTGANGKSESHATAHGAPKHVY